MTPHELAQRDLTVIFGFGLVVGYLAGYATARTIEGIRLFREWKAERRRRCT